MLASESRHPLYFGPGRPFLFFFLDFLSESFDISFYCTLLFVSYLNRQNNRTSLSSTNMINVEETHSTLQSSIADNEYNSLAAPAHKKGNHQGGIPDFVKKLFW